MKVSLKNKILLVALFLLLLTFAGAAIISELEGWRYYDGFYFTVVSVTTTGYGDFVPITDEGKLFIMFFGVLSWFSFFVEVHLVGSWVELM